VSQPRSPRLLALGFLAAAALATTLGLPSGAGVATASAAPAGAAATPAATFSDTARSTPELPERHEEHALVAPEAAAVTYGVKTSTPPVNVPCTQPGNSGNRIAAVYVHFGSSASRISAVRPYIVDALKRANGIVYYSARQTGGSRHLRLATDAACQPAVASLRLPSTAASSFAKTVEAMQAKGYTYTHRKYILFADARAMCGLGQVFNDDQPGRLNRNNRGPQFARVDLGCWSGSAVAHEVFHTLGAVQKSAPRSNTALHCRDERDVMCYSSAGGTSVYTSSTCSTTLLDERLDCNKNDYFHTNPRAGSYLATRWNTARSAFLWGGGPSYR
jgi:hypothetical protein